MTKTWYADDVICGLPCSAWIALTDECYLIGMTGISFFGWPNGLPLIEQEQCVVDIMKIVLSEFSKEVNDGT